MKIYSPYKIFFLSVFYILFFLSGKSFAQLTFARTFQANGMNGGLNLSITNDGGYVVTGQHESSGAGSCDVYVYKRDACGNTNFFNTFGQQYMDGGKCVKQTSDGGYIVTGIIQVDSASSGNYEWLLLKLDAAGNYQWHQAYGNSATNWGMYVQQTTDGGYILGGNTVSITPWW